jgi:hypothetical protein
MNPEKFCLARKKPRLHGPGFWRIIYGKETNMVKVNCESKDSLKLTEMEPFQGKLKKRTPQDIEALSNSLVTEGMMMPFVIWRNGDKKYLLDGHGRKEALVRLAVEDPKVLEADWPVIYVDADDEDAARKALLQITSQYGKITKIGYKAFTATIPDYKAPCVAKFMPKAKAEPKAKAKVPDTVILKIKVKRDKLDQVKEVFGQFDFIEVL